MPKFTAQGVKVYLEESHALPLVDIEITLRTGSVHDPKGKEGLMRMMARMMRMGTPGMRAKAIETAIDQLGAQLSVQIATSHISFQATVIRRNLEAFFSLFSQMILTPAFRPTDLAQVKREALSELIESLDNDKGLAQLRFRSAVFGKHPYGRSVIGDAKSIRAIRRQDIQACYKRHVVGANIVFGFAGDIRPTEAKQLISHYFAKLPKGKAPQDKIKPPSTQRGRHVVIIDKAERTQSQIMIGTLGSRFADKDHIALEVANTAFGGTFTARLMREVRSKRGWSYGASSRFGHNRERDAWWMWTFPATKDAAACIRLQLELFEDLVKRGINGDELRFAKSYIANSYAFEIDTASKRLDQYIDTEVLELPRDYHKKYLSHIRKVTLKQANQALKTRLSTEDLAIVIVSTAKAVQRELAKLPGVLSVTVEHIDT